MRPNFKIKELVETVKIVYRFIEVMDFIILKKASEPCFYRLVETISVRYSKSERIRALVDKGNELSVLETIITEH